MTQVEHADKVVLVGFMGSGKTVVGVHLAELLGWAFVDSDIEVERRLDLTVPEVFEQLGEPEFRRVERAVVAEAFQASHTVIATGGGWPEQEGTMETIPDEAFVVWLQVSAKEALRRVDQSATRPLLQRSDALAFATTLLRRRVKRYALAQRSYDTELANPSELAERIRIAMQPRKGTHAGGASTGTNPPDQDE